MSRYFLPGESYLLSLAGASGGENQLNNPREISRRQFLRRRRDDFVSRVLVSLKSSNIVPGKTPVAQKKSILSCAFT
jgi:hypothetical protein